MFELLNDQRSKHDAKAREILDKAEAEKRELNAAELAEFTTQTEALDTIRSRMDQNARFQEEVKALEEAMRGIPGSGNETASQTGKHGVFVREDGNAAALRTGELFAQHAVVQAHRSRTSTADAAAEAQYGNLGEMLRAMTTTGGSAVIPQSWAGSLIDLARAKSAVLQAGAQIVPMDTKTVNVARLTGDPTAAFREEGSTITASDPTLDNVTLTSKTLSALVIGSMEWFQDADNADAIVSNALAAAIASKIDEVALYGGITTGAGSINLPTPPNPRGILAALNATRPANVLGTGAADGTTPTSTSMWSEVLDLLYTVKDANEDPNAVIWNTKLARTFAKATDTTGQPLAMPSDVAGLQRYTSNRLPSYTLGTTAGKATDAFAGDFTQLLVGQRLSLSLQVLTERYADEGKIGVVVHWRGDVQPARPGAFAVYKGLVGA